MENGGKPDNLPDLSVPLSPRKVRLKVQKYGGLKPAGRPHEFSGKHLKFLESYTQTLDFHESCKAAGVSPASVRKSEYLMREMDLINEAAMYKHRIASAAGTHQRLMAKFEKTFDGGDGKLKGAMASTLARMSEASLRMAGEFDEARESSGISGVQVVINIGGTPDEPEKTGIIDVNATVSDA